MDKKDRRILEADELDALQQQKEEQKYKQKKKKQQQEENQLEEEEEDEEFDSFIVQDDAPISQEQDENNENSQIEQLRAKQNYENSILEFLNFLFHILNLDPKINEEIIVIKRNCLKMLKINDFQKIAEYKEPCIILKIQDVVCKNCLHVIELDVFRDLWVCQECSIPYDKYYLENKLIQEIQNEITLYQIQDLYCVKCFGVKDDYLSVNCPGCSTGYKVNIDSNVTPLIGIDGVKVRNSLLLLAEKNQFSVLKHVILNSWKLM
ncbi:hypothetical protein IMG5_030340 [Ichthyophthirius multifiliis]|uniref:DNA polymerase epsilon catalytic subunit n=1 Tax=Ichthyophthirius multifiliis TaxID=5932 RepID=G0QLH1_ICHMU|nr:hypothetical protein IMG5_030340 [Ichthyophthirius multifiliis]EGR33936.1 hypothetical protein IMG5_030340 [Ichthyophthirius multifiliis]|eukprot:XP_004039240.1 hypothetical protein IMG5_030340 [Ichthyophthirius multifiliis]